MAVLELETDELDAAYRGQTRNEHSKVRFQYFNLPATTVAGDATSEIDLCDLPIGAVRVIPELSRLNHSAFGAGRTLDIGHRAYQKRDDPSEDLVAEDADAFADGIDVSAAGSAVKFGAVTKYDVYSKGGVRVFATVLGDTIPIGATLSGFVAYTYE